ncbi:hypothetical protein D9M72_492460 [compost metagenome]
MFIVVVEPVASLYSMLLDSRPVPFVTLAPVVSTSISELLFVSNWSVVRLTLPWASRLNEPTIDLVAAVLLASL